ncbi:MAG: CotH kinase family protein [Cytophagaceae bacterium]
MNYFKNCIFYSLFFIFFSFTKNNANAQLLINEVSSYNKFYLQDEDNDYSDWIELYNNSSAAINLSGYKIGDTHPSASIWQLPKTILPPYSHILLYASGKDKKVIINHWETAIKENDEWKYLTPTQEISSNWKQLTFNDASWLTGKGGFGYADNDDSTLIPAKTQSLFLRKKFNISDTSKIALALLHIDYDDGFVAHLNGFEVARYNVKNINPGRWDGAESEREARVYRGGKYERYSVSIEQLKKILRNGQNILTVQCHNHSTNGKSDDMSLRANLSFGIKDASVLFNNVPTWFNEPEYFYHSNFKLSNEGLERLILLNPANVIIDQLTIPALNTDHSYGRFPDGGNTWHISRQASPAANNLEGFVSYCNDVISFSQAEGFYSSSITLSLSGSAEIRFTTDGSLPTKSSSLYTTPIVINQTATIRAACFNNNSQPKEISTKTYFINEQTTLPVISIITDPKDFFDPQTGIYMLGPNADSTNNPYFGANFWTNEEKPVFIQYYSSEKHKEFEINAGARIYGNYSRSVPMRSLAITLRSKYGTDKLNYKLFPYKNIDEFDSFVLRNSGNDFSFTHIKDGLNQLTVFEKTSIDIQAYKPCLAFINGQYWGIYNIREKLNEEYIEANSGYDKTNIDQTDSWGKQIEGNNNVFELWWNSINNNMTVESQFKAVADSFDLDNMIDYFAAQIFISNWDWPANNVKAWRPKTGDRKYRFILWDTDISLGIWDMQTASFNQLRRVKNGTNLSMGPFGEMFFALTKNISFRNKFINRSADLMNTIYTTENFKKKAEELIANIQAEIPRHVTRWGYSFGGWEYHVDQMYKFIEDRPAFARQQMVTEFNLVKQVNITLNVQPAGAGIIRINSIIPDNYPWQGVYFDGVPVTITAIPNPGYTFSHWTAPNLLSGNVANKSISLNVTGNEPFTAHFSGAAAPFTLVLSEINYHSSSTMDSGDWFELWNYGTADLDISEYTFKDYKDYNIYTIPAGTVIPKGQRLIICNNITKFKNIYPAVKNVIGSFSFDLSNSSDEIRIYNLRKECFISFRYSDQAPWPTEADGKGYTLELTHPSKNPSDPESWTVNCLYGSPGKPYENCTLSSGKEEEPSSLKIYPNPAKTAFTIELLHHYNITDVTIDIKDATGRSVYHKDTAALSTTITTEHYIPGIYLIKLRAGDKYFINKIIISE